MTSSLLQISWPPFQSNWSWPIKRVYRQGPGRKEKTIIGWQVTRDIEKGTLKNRAIRLYLRASKWRRSDWLRQRFNKSRLEHRHGRARLLRGRKSTWGHTKDSSASWCIYCAELVQTSRFLFFAFFSFFWIQLKPLRQLVTPIYGLVLLYKSISLMLYIVGPYRASVAAGTSFSALSKRWCSLPETSGLLVKCDGLELVD